MVNLSELSNTSRPTKKVQRIGRGVGSHRGGHAGRGGKGDSHRSGYRKRFGYEGGQVPLYRKLPIRGFSRGRFVKDSQSIGLSTIQAYYNDGEVVKFVVHEMDGADKSFTWHFDVPRETVGDLSKLAPTGVLDRPVKVYVGPNPRYASGS